MTLKTIARTLAATRPTGMVTIAELDALWDEFDIRPTEIAAAVEQELESRARRQTGKD